MGARREDQEPHPEIPPHGASSENSRSEAGVSSEEAAGGARGSSRARKGPAGPGAHPPAVIPQPGMLKARHGPGCSATAWGPRIPAPAALGSPQLTHRPAGGTGERAGFN